MVNTRETVYRYRWVIMGVLWTAFIVVYAYRLSISPLAPFIKEDLNLTSAQVGSIMSAASFGYMIGMFPAGWAADRIGVRWLLVIGELVGGIFLLVLFTAPSYTSALIIMAIAGFGGGCLMPATTKGVMVWFPVRERATVMGFKQTSVNIGGIITATALPGLALTLGWHFAFLFLGILAILIGAISFILYREPPVPVLSQSNDNAITTVEGVPAVNQSVFKILKSRDMWLVAVAGLTLLIVEFGVIAHLVLYLTEVLFLPVVAAGFILAVTEAGGFLGKPGSGFLSDRVFGSRRNVYMLWGGIACAMCLLIALWGGSLSWALYPILFILGVTAIGWGGIHLTLVAELAGKELAGTATGTVMLITVAGGVIGPWFFGYIVDISGSYQLAWLACAICAAVCVLALLFVREEKSLT